MTRKDIYQACCLVCYTSVLETGSKRDCERACTGHQHAYGHQVTLLKKEKA